MPVETKIEVKGSSSDKTNAVSIDHTDLLRAASLVILTSANVFAEGLVTFIGSRGVLIPVDQLDGTDTIFPPGLNLGSGAAEIFIVMLSYFIAFGLIFFDIGSANLTFVGAMVSLIFGWFVFIVNAVARPIFNFQEDNVPPLAPLEGWDSKFREEVTFYMGYLVSSMAICAISLGLQFFSLLNLWRYQSGFIGKSNVFSNQARLGYYSLLTILLGAGMLTVGGWTRVQEGPSLLERVVVYPPSLIMYPDVQVMTALWTILYGVLGMLNAITRDDNIGVLVRITGPLIWGWFIWFHVVTQISVAGNQFAGDACVIAGLMTNVALAPSLFSYELLASKKGRRPSMLSDIRMTGSITK